MLVSSYTPTPNVSSIASKTGWGFTVLLVFFCFSQKKTNRTVKKNFLMCKIKILIKYI